MRSENIVGEPTVVCPGLYFMQIAIANELQKSGQQTQAKQLFQTLSLPQTPTKASNREYSQIFHDIVIALVAAKQTEKAIQLINSIEKDFDQESIFN